MYTMSYTMTKALYAVNDEVYYMEYIIDCLENE